MIDVAASVLRLVAAVTAAIMLSALPVGLILVGQMVLVGEIHGWAVEQP